MRKIKNKFLKADGGFTMIELVIVIAIMGILSSVLIPSFINITNKARLRADIATLQQIQTQIEIYMAEKEGVYPGQLDTLGTNLFTQSTVEELVKEDYIKESDTYDKKSIKLQTKKAEVIYKESGSHIALDVTKSDEKVKKPASGLGEKDQEWVVGYDN